MRVTTAIGCLTLGTIATAIVLPEISLIIGIIAVILAFILIMAVIVNLGNPFIVSRYVIHKGWHYSVQSMITFLFPFIRSYKGGGITAIINNNIGNKYDSSDRSWNKFFGLSYGINPHKNSMRLAWRHYITDYYECCWYYYVDGNRYESKPFILEYGKDYGVHILQYCGNVFNTDGIVMDSFAREGYYGYHGSNNYILMPYFGGKSRAPKKMIFNVEIK
jgi:hypothetical protein